MRKIPVETHNDASLPQATDESNAETSTPCAESSESSNLKINRAMAAAPEGDPSKSLTSPKTAASRCSAYLSGGLDFSVVVAVMSNLAKRSVETFTIGFEQEEFNEFKYAKLLADRYKSNHHEILLSPGDDLENMMTASCRLMKYLAGFQARNFRSPCD